ncbi:MAG: peroxiredoxin [Thermomicrobiales bacterium]
MSELIETGVRAPDFELKTSSGDTFRLRDALGTNLPLLIFYPKDFTPGCTRQLDEMNANIVALAAASITPFGVNPGDADSHAKFEESLGLTYPLLVDENSKVAQAYGATKDDGKGIERSVVLIDTDGIVIFAQRGAPGWDVILEALKSVS